MDRYSSEALKHFALELGFASVGVAPAVPIHEAILTYERWLGKGWHADMAYLERHIVAKGSPQQLLENAQSVIALTLNYYQDLAPSSQKISRYALGRDYHKVLRSKMKALEKYIGTEHTEAKNRICVDSAPIFDRGYAHLAGLGWFGKNTMLIDSKRGSWFFIGLLLTTVPYALDSPSVGGCGTCHACIDACPTGAIKWAGDRFLVDSRQCISYQTIENPGPLTVNTGDWVFGCDVCQEVCPFNQPRESQPLRAPQTSEPDFLLPLAQNLSPEMTPEQWDEKTKGSPIRRAGYEGWRRNHRIT